jgi:limonene-1,2-epoxide hydrolase
MRFTLLVLLALALTACGGHKAQTPEQVARAWSAALNADDNAAAGALFAKDAQVIQGDVTLLHTKDEATHWNSLLPCGGAIVGITKQATDEVLVIFRLQERRFHVCDGPSDEAAAVMRVEHGKITLWHQVPPPPPRATV